MSQIELGIVGVLGRRGGIITGLYRVYGPKVASKVRGVFSSFAKFDHHHPSDKEKRRLDALWVSLR